MLACCTNVNTYIRFMYMHNAYMYVYFLKFCRPEKYYEHSKLLLLNYITYFGSIMNSNSYESIYYFMIRRITEVEQDIFNWSFSIFNFIEFYLIIINFDFQRFPTTWNFMREENSKVENVQIRFDGHKLIIIVTKCVIFVCLHIRCFHLDIHEL